MATNRRPSKRQLLRYTSRVLEARKKWRAELARQVEGHGGDVRRIIMILNVAEDVLNRLEQELKGYG